MSSQAIDFSKYEQAAPKTGQIDFSKYEQSSRSAASPITPPSMNVGAPSSEGMHPSFLLGNPDHDATPQPIGEVAKGMIRNVADVTAPVIAHRVGQRAGLLPKGDLYQHEGELKDVPGKATMMMLGGLEGPEAEAAASRIASPAEATGPSAISRVGSFAGRESRSRVPFLSRSIAKPTIARAMPAPIPETNGIPWGSGGQGPIDLRGRIIPRGEETPSVFPGAPLPEHPPAEVFRARGLSVGGRAPADDAAGLGRIPVYHESETPRSLLTEPERGSDTPVETGREASPRIASPNLRAPITENPAVGSLARAMQKSGVPMAERPSLLLKGSGRVNRILGPDEDLTDVMAKSVRLAKRQRGR